MRPTKPSMIQAWNVIQTITRTNSQKRRQGSLETNFYEAINVSPTEAKNKKRGNTSHHNNETALKLYSKEECLDSIKTGI